MPNNVLPLQSSQYQETSGMLARAFQDDPVVVAVLKGFTPENRIKILTVVFGTDLQECGAKGTPIKITKEDRIAGASVIHRPEAYPLPVFAQVGILWKGFTATWSLAAFGRWLKWLTAIDKKHPKEPHFYLEFIGVDPLRQRRGLGSLMLQRLVDWADEERLGCYLETGNPRNVPLYQRFGFQTTAEEKIIGVHIWFMWRPPVK